MSQSEPVQATDIDRATSRASALAIIVLLGFFIAACYIYAQGVYRGASYPQNTFLFVPSARFTDFYQVVTEAASLQPYLKYKSAQYPFLLVVAHLFSWLPRPYSYWTYVAIWCAAFVGLTFAFLRHGRWYDRAAATFTLIFLSYPLLITIDRGNFEGLVFVLVLAFGYVFVKRRYMLAAVLLALAAAMKLLPLFLIVLFLREKKYRALALCVVLTAVVMLISLSVFQGGLWSNLNFLLQGSNLLASRRFANFVSMQSNLVQRGVALLTLLKIARFETGNLAWTTSASFLRSYLIWGAAMAAIVCLYAVYIESVLWKRVAILVFALLLLPTISADYRLLYVFLPALLFIYDSGGTSRLDPIYLVLFGLLLIPKSYYFFQNVKSEAAHDMSIGVVINVLDMVVFSLIIMASGARQWFLDRNAPADRAPSFEEPPIEVAEREPAS